MTEMSHMKGVGGYAPQSDYPWSQPVTMQPGAPPPMPPGAQQPWMAAPMAPVRCPPGLEYLTSVDQLLCHQVSDNPLCLMYQFCTSCLLLI